MFFMLFKNIQIKLKLNYKFNIIICFNMVKLLYFYLLLLQNIKLIIYRIISIYNLFKIIIIFYNLNVKIK